ncbi:MAG TPA: sulfatase-like hydrolase/transferase [Ardenticatenaceae bacterium]|nr:sulfatase-like hydrolase/transferase [Ardenticatenaceae bacterium]
MTGRPNIILFLTDDHGAWAMGCYGNSEVQSPVLDGLAAEGVRFANAFTPSPVCSPARACLLTGRTPSQVGIHDWLQESEPEYGDPDWLAREITLPELLQSVGYHCGLSGKWHLGRSHVRPRGFDWYFGLPRWQGEHVESYTYLYDDKPLTLSGSKTQFITDFALEFLETTPTGRPFFLNVGYIATHSPYARQEPELLALYEGATFRDIPEYVPHPWHKNEDFPQGDAFTRDDLLRRYTGYYAAVTGMDRGVGRIVAWLRERGQLDNTLIVYTSDHGLALGHNGFWGKGNSTRPLNMYETSLRVPLILHWPREFARGHVVGHCVDHYDTFQTICDVAGVGAQGSASWARPADTYPGRSVRPLARGEELRDWRETRYGEYGDLRMTRTERYKLVRRYPDGPDDLFDLLHDPEERINLAGRPEYRELRAALLADLDAFYARYEDPAKSGLRVKALRQHNESSEAWRDGRREARGLQVY